MTSAGPELKRVCFVAMPFGLKAVADAGPGAPAEVDFDALWEHALRPAITDLGYMPVRADVDPGSLVIKDMIERLRFADLVMADVSLPNGNVYYEVGVRHAARETGCVLLAADWSQQLFDIEQFRAIRYPLASVSPTPEDVAQIRDSLLRDVPRLEDRKTPYFEFLPEKGDEARRRTVFRDFMEMLAAFQTRAREIRHRPSGQRGDAVRALAAAYRASLDVPEIATELLRLHRDELGWAETLAFAESLPSSVGKLPYVTEQRLLARGNAGEPTHAIAGLEDLIEAQGANPERLGLIGGRYKRLWIEARAARKHARGTSPGADERRYLDRAIHYYTLGMEQDLNEYYCAGNLPALLKARGERGDDQKARSIEHLVYAACERALRLKCADRWVWATLLGTAFRAGDVDKATEVADRILRDDTPEWQVETTLSDLALAVEATDDPEIRAGLRAIVAQFQ